MVDGVDKGVARRLLTELLDQRRPAHSTEGASHPTWRQITGHAMLEMQPVSMLTTHLLRVSMKRGSTDVSRMAVGPTCVQAIVVRAHTSTPLLG